MLFVNSVFVKYRSFHTGTGTAASVRVGNELGAGNALKAKRSAYTAVALQGKECMQYCVQLCPSAHAPYSNHGDVFGVWSGSLSQCDCQSVH